MITAEKYFEHRCCCGHAVEVVIKLENAGFQGSFEGGHETWFEHCFGDLRVEVRQKDLPAQHGSKENQNG